MSHESLLPRGVPAPARVVLPLAVLALTTLACGGDTTGISEPDPEPGVFEATISGDHSAELVGEAEFGIFFTEGFRLRLTPEDATIHAIEFGYRPEARPGAGSYPLQDPAASELGFSAHYIRQTGGVITTFNSRSGEFVVNTSETTRLEGTFSFQATATLPGSTDELEVIVEGVFSAPCVTAFC